MNREIKFRGWNGRRWTREYTLNEMLCEYLENNGLKEKWVQYTGLKDKNGKEIYEGDLLKDMDGNIDEVIFDGGSFLVKHSETNYDFIAVINYFKVIGNIYENQELLTNKD